jgi:hypothetical protein
MPPLCNTANMDAASDAFTDGEWHAREAAGSKRDAIDAQALELADRDLRTADGMGKASDYTGFLADLARVYAGEGRYQREKRMNELFDRLAQRLADSKELQREATDLVERGPEPDGFEDPHQ